MTQQLYSSQPLRLYSPLDYGIKPLDGAFFVLYYLYMSIQVGHLHKNKIVKDLKGNIIDWYDEANGGWIIKARTVVNQERWQQHLAMLKDRAEAAKAQTMAKMRDDYPEQNPQQNEKVEKLEAELAEMKEMLKQALKKNE